MCLSGDATIEQLAKRVKLPGPGGDVPKGAIVGWRVWELKTVGNEVQLLSTAAKHRWPTKKATVAHKQPSEKPESVGVHAVEDPKDVSRIGGTDPRSKTLVIGQVLLWGKVARHEKGVKGFRAERGYPLVLYTNDYSAQVKLRKAYNCTVARQSANNFLRRKAA